MYKERCGGVSSLPKILLRSYPFPIHATPRHLYVSLQNCKEAGSDVSACVCEFLFFTGGVYILVVSFQETQGTKKLLWHCPQGKGIAKKTFAFTSRSFTDIISLTTQCNSVD